MENTLLEISELVPKPVSLKVEKTENDSDIGSDFLNDSIFDSSEPESREVCPRISLTKKESRLLSASYCSKVFKDIKKIPSLKFTKTSMKLPDELMKIPTSYISPLASQNNVSFQFSSPNSSNFGTNHQLFCLPPITKRLTQIFGFHFKNLKTPVLLRGHEKVEKLQSLTRKYIPKEYIEKYKKKSLRKIEKAKKKTARREKKRQKTVKELIDIIPKLNYENVMKIFSITQKMLK